LDNVTILLVQLSYKKLTRIIQKKKLHLAMKDIEIRKKQLKKKNFLI
jgi:hypothetical protein